jgi:ubiquinone/menaquinone biosynthesis C-methylase UbiE
MSITNPGKTEIALTLLFSRLFRRILYRGFVAEMHLKGAERVLDFGAGWGDNAYYIAEQLGRGGSVTLLDVSSAWQDVARKRLRKYSNVDFVNSDIFSSGLLDESFDIIVISYVIHDIDQKERQAVVQGLARKLKHGGSIWLREPIRKSHGMKVGEIKELISRANMQEMSPILDRIQYRAQFHKP